MSLRTLCGDANPNPNLTLALGLGDANPNPIHNIALLLTRCGDDAIGHGDERYDACMGRHFGGLCPSSAPFPCLDGCNTSYQLCAQLT